MPTRRELLMGASASMLAMHMGPELNALESAKPATLPNDRVAWLSSNLNALGPSPAAVQAMHAATHKTYSYGDEPALALQQRLLQLHNLPFNDTTSDDNYFAKYNAFRENPLIVSSGCTELLKNAAIAFGQPDGNFIEAVPTYQYMGNVAQKHYPKMQRIRVPVNALNQTDLDAIEKAINKNTRFVYLVNPANPTATVIEPKRLMQFINNVPDDVIVIMDEAYMEYATPGTTVSVIDEVLKRNNLLVFKTFSKVYGIAGLRVGYAVGQVPLLKRMNMYSDGMGFQNMLSMIAAKAAIDDTQFVKDSVNHANRIKGEMFQRFVDYGMQPTPSETSFMWVNTGRDNHKAIHQLRQQGIFIKDSEGYWNVPQHVRVSVGSDADMQRFYRGFEHVMGI